MKFGTSLAAFVVTMLTACATSAPPPPPATQPPAPEESRAPIAGGSAQANPVLPAALRKRLGESGARMADDADGALRMTLPGAIAFASGSRIVSQPARPILDRIAQALLDNPGWRVAVEGHTDSVGRELFNQELSRQRATSVMDYLIDQGLDAGKLESVGRGEHAPIADNATAKGRAANRRIEIIVTPAAD
ncbi:MAG: OmpA family protein [Rhodocyclaceae bacterium]|nr:OmpA family protein [Rhodocyclaceae bacterium]